MPSTGGSNGKNSLVSKDFDKEVEVWAAEKAQSEENPQLT